MYKLKLSEPGNPRITVLDLIPESKGIRFKDLQEKCKEAEISYRELLAEVKRLEAAGTVIREAVKAKKGAGTCYKRNVKILLPFGKERYKSFMELFNFSPEELGTEPVEKQIYAALGGIFLTVIDELVMYNLIQNQNRMVQDALINGNNNADMAQQLLEEQGDQGDQMKIALNPDKRLDSALRDFIVPAIKQVTKLTNQIPSSDTNQSKKIIEEALVYAWEHWEEVTKEKK